MESSANGEAKRAALKAAYAKDMIVMPEHARIVNVTNAAALTLRRLSASCHSAQCGKWGNGLCLDADDGLCENKDDDDNGGASCPSGTQDCNMASVKTNEH